MSTRSVLRRYDFLIINAFSFVFGMGLEFMMINWTVGSTNFYSVYREKQSQRIAEALLKKEKSI